jgi:hypothetical protein
VCGWFGDACFQCDMDISEAKGAPLLLLPRPWNLGDVKGKPCPPCLLRRLVSPKARRRDRWGVMIQKKITCGFLGGSMLLDQMVGGMDRHGEC